MKLLLAPGRHEVRPSIVVNIGEKTYNIPPFQLQYDHSHDDGMCPHRAADEAAVLKTNNSKFTRGLEPLCGDARSAKSFEVLSVIFKTECSPINWLQSVLKITRFEKM